MNTSILVAGHVMLDVVVKPSGPIEWVSDTPASVHVSRGGAGANIAQRLALMGCEVTYLACVGRDLASTLALENLRAPSRVHYVDAPTGTLVALVGDDGQRAMLTQTGANALLDGAFLEAQLREHRPTWFHLSGYVLLTPETTAAGQHALSVARELGIGTSTDACSVGPLRAIGLRTFCEAAAGVDVFFANEHEAAELGDYIFMLAPEIVVTQGSHGATVYYGGADLWTHRPSVATVVTDTTGAGDAATGAYLAARLHGAHAPTALEAAMSAAADVLSRLGAD
jgi:sugar/nucleoside kinase (ribokinase family)